MARHAASEDDSSLDEVPEFIALLWANSGRLCRKESRAVHFHLGPRGSTLPGRQVVVTSVRKTFPL